MYDLIIGLETLTNWKDILNFPDLTVTIDHVEFPIQSLGDQSDTALNNIYEEAQEPSISRTATTRVTKILDAKYDKANLPEIVNDNCKHLIVTHRNALLSFNMKNYSMAH